MNEIFINEFLTIGFNDFINKTKNNIFEDYVIACLYAIYGQSLIEAYIQKQTNMFEKIIKKYKLNQSVYEDFMDNLIAYEGFKKSLMTNPIQKTEILSNIQTDLIKMLKYKTVFESITDAQIAGFESIFLNDQEIKKYTFNYSNDPNKVLKYYKNEKRNFSEDIILEEEKPNLLDEFTYARFGVSYDDVKDMDYRMINKLNDYIKNKIEVDKVPNAIKQKFRINSVLTSGSGAVDALLIIAIIATEISIGLIYLFLHM